MPNAQRTVWGIPNLLGFLGTSDRLPELPASSHAVSTYVDGAITGAALGDVANQDQASTVY
jgi:hypothetical protein